MKTKMNVLDEIENLIKRMNKEGVESTFFSVYCNEKEKELGITLTNGKEDELAALLASIITRGYDGEEDVDEGFVRTAHTLVKAVGLVLGSTEDIGVAMRVMVELSRLALKRGKKENEEEDDEEAEDCSTCSHNRTCNLPDAIAYRKANGIRKPKSKRGGRKHECN